jgi:hypothetical protein
MSRGDASNLGNVPINRLLSMARRVKAKREKAIEESGQVVAELHKRGVSWRVIGAEVGVPPDTARYWAKDYLKSSEDSSD